MDPRISLITLGVSDLSTSLAFYRDGLGWPAQTPSPEVAFFQLRNIIFSLYGREALAEDATVSAEGGGFRGVSLAYNVDSDAAVNETLAAAKAAGATIVKPGEKVFWGGYSGYFADPDGHLWEVAHNPFWTLAADGTITLNTPT